MRKINERKGWDEIKHDNGDKRKINREKEDDRKDDKGILQMKLSMKAEESDKERKREKGHQKVRKHGRKDENTGAATETYSIIMDRDARRLDTEGPENNKQIQCFSQRSEESVFRFK